MEENIENPYLSLISKCEEKLKNSLSFWQRTKIPNIENFFGYLRSRIAHGFNRSELTVNFLNKTTTKNPNIINCCLLIQDIYAFKQRHSLIENADLQNLIADILVIYLLPTQLKSEEYNLDWKIF